MSTTAEIIAKIQREAAAGTIATGDNAELFEITRIPSGILVFDLLTNGGIPENRFTEFYGPRSGGKTTLALRVINNYLKVNPARRALYVDYEHTYDAAWTALFVENLDQLLVVRPDYGEQGVDYIESFTEADDMGLIVIDSLAMQTPRGMLTPSAEDDTFALHPKLTNKLLRKGQAAMTRRQKQHNPLTFLVINQTTANTGFGSQYNPDIKPGGRMKEYMWSLDVRCMFMEMKKAEGLPAFWKYKVRIEKNKTGLAKTEGEYTMIQVPIDSRPIGTLIEAKQLFAYGKRSGVITKEGKDWVARDQDGSPIISRPNKDQMEEALVGEVADRTKSAILFMSRGRSLWEEEDATRKGNVPSQDSSD